MEPQTEKQRPPHGQLISVPHKDTIRLLEVYVKRSLSLNDGSLGLKRSGKKEKWVTMARKHRRSSSDPSLFLANEIKPGDSEVFRAAESLSDVPEKPPEDLEKSKKPKKNKKPSFLKTFFGFFTRKNDEDSEEDPNDSAEVSVASEAVTTCLPTPPVTLQKKSTRKSSLKRKMSKRLSKRASKLLNPADITGVGAVISVEPTYAYYEKVSEELEKIVHEVKEKEEVEVLSDAEVLNRLIALTKEQGDAMDDKLKDNPTLNNFFQRLTYSSFQKMADAYLEKEATPNHNPPPVHPTAPELVKLAFTLDFTARIAGLSKQNVGHITCLGNRYLQDRFEYTQACTDHPWSDSED
ncbi:uncharacterized protein LOC106517596 [Austrofundulus limnaeus]|uniref:Uncharacterized protein LOC106517596 n=1 Tax=Austrofundulus limnaeus TaxID=52670 RepID=A0A2I4B8C0_AUSLI|nr:PREDICTED: uncharacterized protein LOC106517596 [Austrofundulus limnaeus]